MKFSASLRATAVCFTLLAALLVTPAFAQRWDRYGPGTRSQSTAIYDPATNQMVMFGGQHAPTSIDFNDLWAVQHVIPPDAASQQNLNWTKVVIAGRAPSLRFGMSAVYNATSNRMIIFGGGTGFPGPCVNDLWVLKNANSVGGTATWVQQTPTGTPPPIRQGHTAVYDAANNKMIVFGGTDCKGAYYKDLWILSNADGATGTPSWAQVTPSGTGPSARSLATAIYDSANNIMTVYGGGTSNTTVFGDTFTLTNANGITGTPTWKTLVGAGNGPGSRSSHSAVYDAANNRMIVFGGFNNRGGVLNDQWVLTNANGVGTSSWIQVTPTAPAPFRALHTAFYDPVTNYMVIFGGDSQLARTFTDDHVFILTHANGL